MTNSELTVVGLTCCLVGVFFLANSIIFRKLKNVIAVFFNVKMRSLHTIKDYPLNNLQVAVGFLFLAVGFLLQVYANLPDVQDRVTLWVVCGSIVVGAVLVYLVARSYSRHTFKKYLREFFRSHPEAFSRDTHMVKEIGAFLGIRHTEEMTVEDYQQQVRSALRIGGADQAAGGGLAPEGGRRRRDLGALQKSRG
ncbi:MAG: hypothetical protein KDC87_18585 [Planctomycetes bacterium]|nr:hypothetical protein [Planctomycetota bacterium]MCB9869558.1 hypothetical protein [Planctomycetota bacterium]